MRVAQISLVISDIDATLITPEHVITERAMRAVRSLHEQGILFTVASHARRADSPGLPNRSD